MKRTLDEIINLVRHVYSVNICYGQSTTGNLFLNYFILFNFNFNFFFITFLRL
jgi:hypothetical protein